jgi:predicted ATPase
MMARRRWTVQPAATGAPFLHRIESLPEKIDPARYPFNIRAFAAGIDLTFRSRVTFFVGENGSGKSTLLQRSLSAADSIPKAATAIVTGPCSPIVLRWPRPSSCHGGRR